jgi:uncharacterized protein YeeX (DUF496 family)
MSGIEKNIKKENSEFPNLEYIIQDVKNRLQRENITSDHQDFEKQLQTAIRLILLKEKYGVLKPGQPSEEKQEWFSQIRGEFIKEATSKDWIIKSASLHQKREEKRAGQSYSTSDLE